MQRILLLLTLLIPAFLFAQKNATVKGVVFDTASKKGLSYATVTVLDSQDSTLVNFTKADSTGKFQLNKIPKGNYLLTASYVGYSPAWKPLLIKDAEEINIGKIEMTDAKKTDEFTVTSKRPPMVMNGDTLEFNTENFKTQPNAVVEDLLKKLPGVTVDPDGTIKVNGQTVNKLFVNGKEFFTGDPKMATKNLDADAIDKIQFFDKKSDRSEFTGIDDGNSQKAINLKIKKDRNKSVFGKLSAGAGTDSRYDLNANVNKFNNDQQISFIGMGNNVNKQGFGIMDVMNFTGELSKGLKSGGGISIKTGSAGSSSGLPVSGFGANQQGVAQTFAGGLNYSDSWNKKTDFNASGVISDMNLATDKTINRQYILPTNSYNYLSTQSGSNDNNQQKINMTIDQKIDSFNSFKLTPALVFQQQKIANSSDYTSTTPEGLKLNDGFNNTYTNNNGTDFNVTGLYRKKFRKKGRTFSANISLAYNHSLQDGLQFSKTNFYTNGAFQYDSLLNQKSHTDATTQSAGAILTYTEPVGKRSLIEFSGFYNTNIGKSDKQTFNFDSSSLKHDLINPLLSNKYENIFNNGGGTINFLSNYSKFNYTIGASLQASSLKSTNNTTGQTIKQTFTDVLPSALLQYKPSATTFLRFNYSTTAQQPSTTQLQPVQNVSDPLNIIVGNPDLKRAYIHNAVLSYFSTNIIKKTGIFANVTFSKNDNAIVSADSIQANGARISTYKNASGVYNLFGNLNYSFAVKQLKSRVSIGINTSLMHNISFINSDRNVITNQSWGPSLNWNYNVDSKIDINASARYNFSKADYLLQPELNSNYLQQIYSMDMTNYLPWGVTLNNNFTYTLNSGLAAGYNTNIPYWSASLAKAFLKNKRGELKLSAFDLLNQNSGIKRTVSQSYIEDLRYNVLQRYLLLSFTFNLSKGSKQAGPQIMIKSLN